MKTKPLKFADLETLELSIKQYFDYCDEKQRPYTLAGLGVWLGTNRMTLLNYEDKGDEDPYGDCILRAKAKIEAWVEEALYDKGKVSGAKFALKNNNDWKEQVDHDVTSQGEKIEGFNYIIPNASNDTTNT